MLPFDQTPQTEAGVRSAFNELVSVPALRASVAQGDFASQADVTRRRGDEDDRQAHGSGVENDI